MISEMRKVSKTTFLNALACPTLGWNTHHHVADRGPTAAEEFRMEQGRETGAKVRELYPDGILVRDLNVLTAREKTVELMADTEVEVIFEACFIAGNYDTRADILVREGTSWKMVEVKSKVRDEPELVDDMAYTSLVMQKAGTTPSKVAILLISKEYRLGMAVEDLFVETDHTAEVFEKMKLFAGRMDEIEAATNLPEKPEPVLIWLCRKCPHFRDCTGKDVENHIFDLPWLKKEKFNSLRELGVDSIESVPKNFALTPNQARIRDSVNSGLPDIGEGLHQELDRISWPAYYLDFETVMTALPLYPEIAPFRQIPTQYSIHVCTEPGVESDHREYLANHSKDCRRELAERLLADLDSEGSIIAYSSFEKTVINGLAGLFPNLETRLKELIDRITNLEAIVRKHFYHPDFHGRTSIKKTLPVLVPEMSYEGLEIFDGESAAAEFACMAKGEYNSEKVAEIRASLLEYCKQDTLAMVKLHEKLLEYCSPG